MPVYEYECRSCGTFPLTRSIEERDVPAECPECFGIARRQITAPNLSLMGASRRQAFQRNEKSQHEPGTLNRHRCGSGCGCGTGASATRKKPKRTIEVPKLGKFELSRKRQRPWMLGH